MPASDSGSSSSISDPPEDINPYEVLDIPETATEKEVTTAYRRLALRHHPDKPTGTHQLFQTLAFAYSILSDPSRRTLYDNTGRTTASDPSLTDDSFDWHTFYRTQFADVVTASSIAAFATTYKASPEERSDVLAAYEKFKGMMSKLYQVVMLSDPSEDEDRYRAWIDAAIASGEVPAHKRYTQESSRSRAQRIKSAHKEEKEAVELAKELGLSSKPSGEDQLRSLILQRAKERATDGGWLQKLEEKYAPPERSKAPAKKRKTTSNTADKSKPNRPASDKKKRPVVTDETSTATTMDEPPEEAFIAMAARSSKSRNPVVGDELIVQEEDEDIAIQPKRARRRARASK